LIDQTDTLLKDWVLQIVGTVPVTFSLPIASQTGQSISLYLWALAPAFASALPAAGGRRPPLQIELRYLVTTWADDPQRAHQMLGDLVFAALDNSQFEVDLGPLPSETWLAFGVAPRPAFVLRVPVRLERPETDKFVRAPLVMRAAPMTALHGRVVTPDGLPLPGLRVVVPSLQLSSLTDAQGEFRFPAVPIDSPIRQLHISGKGRDLDFTLEAPASADEPIVIHFDPLGEKGA
jgi:hypothetical protein